MKQYLVFGRRGQGKTTLALWLALQNPGGVAIYDINAQIRCFPRQTTHDLGIFANWVDASDFRCLVFRPSRDVWGEFEGFAEILWRKRGFTLLVDEASQLQTSAGAHTWLDRFVRMAPRDDVAIIQTMHRPRDSATLCRSLATDWFVFFTTLGHDLTVIEEHCGEDHVATVQGLGEASHRVFHWDDAHGRAEVLNDPQRWFMRLR